MLFAQESLDDVKPLMADNHLTEPKITVYGAYWRPDCRRAKEILGEQVIPFDWVDIEQDKEAEQFVLEKYDGKRIIPTIAFETSTPEVFAAGVVRHARIKQVASALGEGAGAAISVREFHKSR